MSIFLKKEPKSANFTQFPKFKKEIKKVFVLKISRIFKKVLYRGGTVAKGGGRDTVFA